jgi:hypothetical protein
LPEHPEGGFSKSFEQAHEDHSLPLVAPGNEELAGLVRGEFQAAFCRRFFCPGMLRKKELRQEKEEECQTKGGAVAHLQGQ